MQPPLSENRGGANGESSGQHQQECFVCPNSSVSSSLRASQSKATTAIGGLPASIKDDTHAAVAPPHGRDEGDDDYEHVVLVLDATCRVISDNQCQWIVQKRRGHRWKSVSFCRTQAALIERSGATGAALAVLEGLPEWHEVAP